MAQQGTLFLSYQFGVVDSELEPQKVAGAGVLMSNVHAPKRAGDDSDAPFPQRGRTTQLKAKTVGDSAFRAHHRSVGWNRYRTLAIVEDDETRPCVSQYWVGLQTMSFSDLMARASFTGQNL